MDKKPVPGNPPAAPATALAVRDPAGALSAAAQDRIRAALAAALRWADVAVKEDGTGRLTIARSKTDQDAAGAVQFLGRESVQALEAIRPDDAEPTALLFGLSARQLSRRIKAACRAAGLAGTFSGHSARVGMAQDLSAAGAELPELMQAGRWSSSAMPARYTRNQAAGRSAVAKFYQR